MRKDKNQVIAAKGVRVAQLPMVLHRVLTRLVGTESWKR